MQTINQTIWQDHLPFQQLISKIQSGEHASIRGVPDLALSSFLLAILQSLTEHNIVYIQNKNNRSRLSKFKHEIERLEINANCKILTADNNLLFDHHSEGSLRMSGFAGMISALRNAKQSLYLSNASILLQHLPLPESYQQKILEQGNSYNINDLTSELLDYGYTPVENVMEIGQFAHRGEILDIFPNNYSGDLPIRIVFFDREIESIKSFEPWSQRSVHTLDHSIVHIASRNLFQPFKEENAIMSLLEKLGKELDESEQTFWEEDLVHYQENWYRFLPWLSDDLSQFSNILPYIQGNTVILVEDYQALMHQLETATELSLQNLQKALKRKSLPISQEKYLKRFLELPLQACKESMQKNQIVEILL